MFNQYLTRLPSKEEGATAVEYGLIAGLIAVAPDWCFGWTGLSGLLLRCGSIAW